MEKVEQPNQFNIEYISKQFSELREDMLNFGVPVKGSYEKEELQKIEEEVLELNKKYTALFSQVGISLNLYIKNRNGNFGNPITGEYYDHDIISVNIISFQLTDGKKYANFLESLSIDDIKKNHGLRHIVYSLVDKFDFNIDGKNANDPSDSTFQFLNNYKEIANGYKKIGYLNLYKKIIYTGASLKNGYYKEYVDYISKPLESDFLAIKKDFESKKDFLETWAMIKGYIIDDYFPKLAKIIENDKSINDGFILNELNNYFFMFSNYILSSKEYQFDDKNEFYNEINFAIDKYLLLLKSFLDKAKIQSINELKIKHIESLIQTIEIINNKLKINNQ